MKKRAPGRPRKSTAASSVYLTNFRRVWICFIVAATSAPYLFNWWSAPAGFHYTWIIPPYPEDSFGYLAWAEQAARGAWLFKIKFTSVPHAAFLFHPLFLVCGWLSAIFSCPLGIVFLVVKAIGIILFFLVLYRYFDFLGLTGSQSTAASVLLSISSGIGGILLLLGVQARWAAMSTDLWMPESNTFWSLLWNPLFPFSLTLMLLSIFWVDRGTRTSLTTDMWRAGLAAGVMSLLHAYSVPLLFAWSGIVVVARHQRQSVRYLWPYFAAALPFVVYVAALSRFNPILERHSQAGTMKSPPVIEYVLGLGLPLVAVIAGLILFRTQWLKNTWQIVLWFLLALAFAYAPFWFQRKLIFGAHIPLCIIAAIVFDLILVRWLGARQRQWAWVAAAVFLAPVLATTSGVLLLNQAAQVQANEDGAYFLSDAMLQALNVLRDKTRPEQVVLATPQTSRIIPGYAGNTVVWGHWAMSVDFQEQQAKFSRIFEGRSELADEAKAAEFWGEQINYFFADGKFKESMEQSPFLWKLILKGARKIFENDEVVIYERPETL